MSIGAGEFLALAIIALLVLGPDKLPKFAADAARFLRQVRRMANNAKEDVRRELGPELQDISLDDLNPRSLMRKHLLDDSDLDDDLDFNSNGRSRDTTRRVRDARTANQPDRSPGETAAPYDPEAT